MAATVAGALKAWLETQGLSTPVFRRHAPQRDPNDPSGQSPYPLPYITITEGITAVIETHEDGGVANGGATAVSEELQVDLWMYENDPAASDSGRTENYSLTYALARALDGAPLGTFGTPAVRIYGCVLKDGPRELGDNADPNLIRKMYSVEIRRYT
jgi:hypothetical protein